MFFFFSSDNNRNQKESISIKPGRRKFQRNRNHRHHHNNNAEKEEEVMTKPLLPHSPPSPPSRQPNISERISMLQMAKLHEKGYHTDKGIELVLPPMLVGSSKSSICSSSSTLECDSRSKKSSSLRRINSNKNNNTNKITTIVRQRFRFVLRSTGSFKRDVPAEDVWIQLVQEGRSKD